MGLSVIFRHMIFFDRTGTVQFFVGPGRVPAMLDSACSLGLEKACKLRRELGSGGL